MSWHDWPKPSPGWHQHIGGGAASNDRGSLASSGHLILERTGLLLPPLIDLSVKLRAALFCFKDFPLDYS